MALPRQAQESVDRANEAQKGLNAPPENTGKPALDGQLPPGTDELAIVKGLLESADKRNRVLQLKYNAEVPRLHKDLQDAQGKIKELESKQAAPPPAAPITIDKAAVMNLLSEEEKSTFGDKFVDAVLKVVNAVVDTKTPQIVQPLVDSQVKPVKDDVAADRERRFKDSQNQYYDSLDRGDAKWEELQKDPGFLKWLGDRDPATGDARGAILQRADKALDSITVLEVFSAFRSGREIGAPANTGNSPGASTENISPPPGRASETPAGSKKMWKRSEIKAYYQKRATDPAFRASPDATAQESDIFAAQKEQRIIEDLPR